MSSRKANQLKETKQTETDTKANECPDSLEDFMNKMLVKFDEIDSKQYPVLDREIGDKLHQFYKPKLGGQEALSKSIFALIDTELGKKQSATEAKSYKKMLSAV